MKKYNLEEWQWDFGGHIKTIADMTIEELQQALCQFIEVIDNMYGNSIENVKIYAKYNHINVGNIV